MLSAEKILQVIPQAFDKFEVAGDLPHGKVCDFYITPDGKQRVLIATDRLNVFDHLVGLVPYKGQILNELSAWWFQRTTNIVPNHFLSMPDPNVTIAREARPISLAVVVRGYITGVTKTSLWTRYQAGEREIYGIKFSEGMRKNDPLPHPLITPTTKSTVGRDDRQALTDVVGQNYLTADVWAQVQKVALALYTHGKEVFEKAGLILVDTKYEFGFDLEKNTLMLIDEIHTPETSRIWKADSYEAQRETRQEPENMDKELARLWYDQQGFRGKDTLPPLSEEMIVVLSQAFQQVYEMITGQTFQPASYPPQDRIEAALKQYA